MRKPRHQGWRTPTPKQRRQEIVEQYVFSRRTMMALMALVCTPGLETLINNETEPPKPEPPDNPTIPTLPQKDSPATQQERQMQLAKTREEYQLGLRLPNSPRVETLPEQEAFSEGFVTVINILTNAHRRSHMVRFMYEQIYPIKKSGRTVGIASKHFKKICG